MNPYNPEYGNSPDLSSSLPSLPEDRGGNRWRNILRLGAIVVTSLAAGFVAQKSFLDAMQDAPGMAKSNTVLLATIISLGTAAILSYGPRRLVRDTLEIYGWRRQNK